MYQRTTCILAPVLNSGADFFRIVVIFRFQVTPCGQRSLYTCNGNGIVFGLLMGDADEDCGCICEQGTNPPHCDGDNGSVEGEKKLQAGPGKAKGLYH